MKTLFLILFFTLFNLLGQDVFYSPFTQTFPNNITTEIAEIESRIIFEPNTITIITEPETGKETEILHIQEINFINGNFVYLCTNRGSQKITIAIPEGQKEIEIIDYYYRAAFKT